MKWKYTEDKKEIKFERGHGFYWRSQDNSFKPEDREAHKIRNREVIKRS